MNRLFIWFFLYLCPDLNAAATQCRYYRREFPADDQCDDPQARDHWVNSYPPGTILKDNERLRDNFWRNVKDQL